MGKIALKWLESVVALWLLLWLPAGSAWAAAEPPQARKTVTVIEFSVRGELNEQAGAIIADLMMSAIANTGRFILKDRLPLSAAAKIAKAQELGSTGLLDPKTAAELGRRYEVDAVVTGGISKLGDLITVTARLIDTKTASLLGSGQIQDKDIDSIQIKINDLSSMVLTPPPPPPTYALIVRANPADANIRLLNHPTPYQPGMRLPSGDYEIEVTRPGHVTRKEAVRIKDQDMALDVTLEKAKYALTVRPEPADAQIRLLKSPVAYQPGVPLAPGDYEVEVTREGYVSHRFPVRIVDSEVSVPVALQKLVTPPPVRQYHLTVQVDPPRASVRLLNIKTPYQPGVSLQSGSYKVEVSHPGYESAQVAVLILDSDVTVPVKLVKQPEPVLFRLTVQADPANARIRLLGTKVGYKPGVALPPGSYTVEVSQSGYETQRVTARIADSDVTMPVALVKEPEPVLFRLTVQADPADAQVRLRGARATYKAGVSLPPGNYTVEVSRTGYETKQMTVRINDSDMTMPVTLVKQPEPVLFRLTVQANPADAQVRLRGAGASYRPGIALAPGSYTVEVSKSGYETQRVTVRMTDSDVTMPVALVKEPEPELPKQYQLTVQANPADAQVRLRGVSASYRPGIALAPGSYTVEVSKSGYETQRVTVRMTDGDVTMPVALVKEPEPELPKQYHLTVQANPADAQVRLRGAGASYRPGIALAPGSYTVEVSKSGYETQRVTVRMTDSDVTMPVALEKIASVSSSPSTSLTSRSGEWRIGSVQVDSSLSGVDRSEVSRVLNAYVGRTVTRDALLDGALRVYQSTGITLSFVVRSGASGGAELYARAAHQTRRTYESGISIITRSQLEQSGFNVSVE